MKAHSERLGLTFKQNLVISAAIHILLLTLVPAFSSGTPASNRYIEVDVLPPPPKKPDIEKLSLAGGKPKANIGGDGKTEAASHKRGDKWQWKSLPAGVISTPAADVREKETVPMFVPVDDLPVKGQWSDKRDTASSITENPALPAGEINATIAKTAPPVLEGAIGPAGGKGGPPTSGLVFDWTGKPRRTLYEPAKPRYSSAIEGTVEAKIWVDADGHVANAMVVKKLDTVLEQLALNYIKQCRFEPLKVKDDKLQTGVAKFYFKLE